jgi:O-antigen/teichoic acid export membrane protein
MSIFQSVRRLFKQSAVYGIGHIINRALGFLLLPLYTNLFPRDDFGVAGLMFTYLAIFTIIYTYGLDAAFFRFYILEESKATRDRIFSTAAFTILITCIFFSGLLYFAAKPIAGLLFSQEAQHLSVDLPYLIRLAAGILAFDSLAFLPFLILRAEEKPVPFIIYKFLNILINVGCNVIYLIVLKYGIEGIFIANLISSLATFLLLLPMTFKHISLSFSKPILKDLLVFGMPYLPSTLAVVFMDTIDRPFIERLDSLQAAGLYNAGAKLGMFMALAVTAFRFAWHPFFLSTAKQANAKEIFSKIFTYVLLACLAVFLVMSLFIDNIAHLRIGGFSLIGKEFWDCTVVVPAIMLAYIMYAAYLNFLIGVYLEKKTKYLPGITIAGMIANLLGNYFLIPVIGILGAAWARFIAYLVMAVALYSFSQRLYRIHYEWIRILKMCAVTAVIFWIGQFAFVRNHVTIKLALSLALPVGLFIIGFFERAEIDKIKMILASRIPLVKSR